MSKNEIVDETENEEQRFDLNQSTRKSMYDASSK